MTLVSFALKYLLELNHTQATIPIKTRPLSILKTKLSTLNLLIKKEYI